MNRFFVIFSVLVLMVFCAAAEDSAIYENVQELNETQKISAPGTADFKISFGPIGITAAGETIAIISVGIAMFSTVVRLAVLDRSKMREMKEKMKEHQSELKEATKSGDKKRAQKAQEEFMKLTMENMRYSFKPMIFTFIPFIIIFGWLQREYNQVGLVANLFGYGIGWFGWYFVCAMVFSSLINKLLKVT